MNILPIQIIIFLSIVFIPLLVFSSWNFYSIRKLLKLPVNAPRLSDDKYYELKYRLEYITTIYTVITLVLGVIGFGLKDHIGDLEQKVTEANLNLEAFSNRIHKDSIILAQNETKIKAIDTTQKVQEHYLEELISKKGKELNTLYDSTINNIKKTHTYHCNIIFKEAVAPTSVSSVIHQFNELKTISGGSLPLFDKPPLITATASEGGVFHITEITKTSFRITMQDGYYPSSNGIYHITLTISDPVE